MAFDGIVISNLVRDFKEKLTGGRIVKISQPEKDELVLTIKNYEQMKLFISAGASLPLIYFTSQSFTNPAAAPNFCMLLRKHFNSARILDVDQPGLERIIRFKVEHLDEMGDLCIKYIIVEIMGKHSNIILTDSSLKIIDSIKHVSGLVSSVREVLPGREYFIPNTADKKNPLECSSEDFKAAVFSKPAPLSKAIYTSLTGISPLIANEICFRAGISADTHVSELSDDMQYHIYNIFSMLMDEVRNGNYYPHIVYSSGTPVEFSSIRLNTYSSSGEYEIKEFSSISEVLESYYAQKNAMSRIHQKSADLRRILSNLIERNVKKYDLQLKQLEDTQKREKYKIYGELLTAFGYGLEPGSKSVVVNNYYDDNNELTIPLDPELSAVDNAKAYFEKYSKLKRTYEALSKLTLETKEEFEHLDSIRTALDIAVREDDLLEIKEELMQYGYIRRHFDSKKKNGKKDKKPKFTSEPFHYISSDGYHMYVGKNNFQNDELTFKFASGGDWWFHAKGIPGSHVIVKSDGNELPDRVYEEAGSLAAYYSKERDSAKVEIDYLERKNVKKPAGAKPGFVVYYTNYSLMASPDISNLTLVSD